MGSRWSPQVPVGILSVTAGSLGHRGFPCDSLFTDGFPWKLHGDPWVLRLESVVSAGPRVISGIWSIVYRELPRAPTGITSLTASYRGKSIVNQGLPWVNASCRGIPLFNLFVEDP